MKRRKCTPPHYHVLTHFERWDGGTAAVSMTAQQTFIPHSDLIFKLLSINVSILICKALKVTVTKRTSVKRKKKKKESFLCLHARFTSVVSCAVQREI